VHWPIWNHGPSGAKSVDHTEYKIEVNFLGLEQFHSLVQNFHAEANPSDLASRIVDRIWAKFEGHLDKQTQLVAAAEHSTKALILSELWFLQELPTFTRG
jgi:hypothetical protein